ncbi:major facilitator superfamily transporter [Ceratobasidium sp. AG-Ba]|nr:major facilitator superfamily transporter [Ceratobasidium sp. AG-Ba]QRW14166.1 major facilitator superfamily transporter [Ceratobasidium sp. AG-Ba]
MSPKSSPSVSSLDKHSEKDLSLAVPKLPAGEQLSDNRLLRKIDWNILPLVSLLHLLSFLDRTNFGNAKIAGMEKDLKMKGFDYNIAASVFYITYCAFEIPSNLAMKKIGASRWFPGQMVAWGLVTALMCVVNTYPGIVLSRVFLGVTEAGLFPGINFYISLWYPRGSLAQRIAIFYASTTSSGAFSGILAYGIVKMDGLAGLKGWQWIFLLEGLVTILVGLVSFFYMHDLPENAKFLDESERTRLLDMMKADSPDLATHFSPKFVKQAFTDYKSWVFSIVYLGGLIPVYAFSLFIPQIIKDLGYTAAKAQLMSTPPYCLAMFVAFAAATASDKVGRRAPFVMGLQLVSITGYAMVRATKNPDVAYAGIFLTCAGVYSTVPCLISWISNNVGGDTKRAVVLAMAIGIGNLGGICSSFVYRARDAPRYKLGHNVVIASLCMAFAAAGFSWWNLDRLNKRKEAQCKAEGITHERKSEFREMGDASPLFRYVL